MSAQAQPNTSTTIDPHIVEGLDDLVREYGGGLLTPEAINTILDKYESPDNYSLYHQLLMSPEKTQLEFWKGKSTQEIENLLYNLEFSGNSYQQVPPEDQFKTLFCLGRSAGKSYTGASIVNAWAIRYPRCNIAMIAPDKKTLSEQMAANIVERCPPSIRKNVVHNLSTDKITYPNGSTVYGYLASAPNTMRGPSISFAWIDEPIAMGERLDEVLTQLTVFMRSNQFSSTNDHKQVIFTTTPEATPSMLALRDQPDMVTVRGTSMQNGAISRLDRYRMLEGLGLTRKGRQEIFASWEQDQDGALFKKPMFDDNRVSHLPCSLEELDKCIISVDPTSSKRKRDIAAIFVIGLKGRNAYLLADVSLNGTQDEWGQACVKAFYRYNCDYVLYESNAAGAATEFILRTIDDSIPCKAVVSVESKERRAEPAVIMYEHGRVQHVGPAKHWSNYENQCLDWVPAKSRKSPDLIDAATQGINHLLHKKREATASFF